MSHPVDPNALLRPHAKVGNFSSIESADLAEITIKHAFADVLNFRGWEIPNAYVMYQAYKIHKELKRHYP